MASIRGSLTSHEEITLRKIVVGDSNVSRVRDADIMRLVAMGLIQMTVTDAGLERYRSLTQPIAIQPTRRRPKSRGTPFFGVTQD